MSWARPSTIAVLPTPGSPIRTGLFFLRRARIWMTRSISLLAADDRVELALAGELGQVAAELVEGGVLDFFSACRRLGAALPSSFLRPLAAQQRSVFAALSRFTPSSVSTCAATPSSPQQAQQEVLGSDVVVVQVARLRMDRARGPSWPAGVRHLIRGHVALARPDRSSISAGSRGPPSRLVRMAAANPRLPGSVRAGCARCPP